jgi:IS30 family transposase
MRLVEKKLRKHLSPEQISGELKALGRLSISHETIYKHIWQDKADGGDLWCCLRQCLKRRRKRNGSNDSRGRLAGKRSIDDRPKLVNNRSRIGDWEIDTMLGKGSNACVLTMVERKTGFLLMGKLASRTTSEVNRVMKKLIRKHSIRVKTITADNGTEFHGYKAVEDQTGVPFFFAHPHRSWERGTNENTNGLIRQYLPKGRSLFQLTQATCNAIALRLNRRPRKRHQFATPEHRYYRAKNVALGT